MKEKRLFNTIEINNRKGVIVKINKKRRWTYYDIVFEDANYFMDDFWNEGVEYETFRQDQLS